MTRQRMIAGGRHRPGPVWGRSCQGATCPLPAVSPRQLSNSTLKPSNSTNRLTPLDGAQPGDIGKITQLINATSINMPDKSGFTPLMHAALLEDLSVVRLLTDNNADISVHDKMNFTVVDQLDSSLRQLDEKKIATARNDLARSRMTPEQMDEMLGPKACLPPEQREIKRKRITEIIQCLKEAEKKRSVKP